jgi:hypothetical protein
VVVSGVCEYCGRLTAATRTETDESPVPLMSAAPCARCGQQVTLRRRKRPAPSKVPRNSFHPDQQ